MANKMDYYHFVLWVEDENPIGCRDYNDVVEKIKHFRLKNPNKKIQVLASNLKQGRNETYLIGDGTVRQITMPKVRSKR